MDDFRLANPTNLTFFNAGIKRRGCAKSFIIFKILLMDCLPRTKKVLSSANAVSLISISPTLNSLIALSFLIRINKISHTNINKYGDRGSPCFVPLCILKKPVDELLFVVFASNVLIH